jgi:zinc-ribbon domain
MFCPKCATQNLEGASFCRSCGANISLIPQALSGQLPQASEDEDIDVGRRRRRRHGRELSLDHAFKNIFMGIAFLFVSIALAFSRMGYGWWFWMLLPAFSLMGSGIAQYIRLKEREKQSFLAGTVRPPSMQARRPVDAFPTRNTGELVAPPPSVTEGTTRHLGAEVPTRHLDESS